MKFKNFINIKANGKSIDFHNLILDEYLERFVKTQLDVEQNDYGRNRKKLRTIYIKFDTPLTFNSDSKIDGRNVFDIAITQGLVSYKQEISEKQVTAKYNFKSTGNVYDLHNQEYSNISNFYDRKITAIGFNFLFTQAILGGYICSILDTSNYNIYFEENQEFALTRKDTIISDANFWCNNKRIKGPLHLLIDGGGPNIIPQKTDMRENTYAQLYSVGFSSYKDFIAKEYVIGSDITATNNGTSISLSGLQNKISNNLIYPHNIQPNNSLYPLKANYKYVIYKYKIFQEVYTINPSYVEGGEEEFIKTWIDTGVYYLQSVPLNKVGNIDLTIKYERSN